MQHQAHLSNNLKRYAAVFCMRSRRWYNCVFLCLSLYRKCFDAIRRFKCAIIIHQSYFQYYFSFPRLFCFCFRFTSFDFAGFSVFAETFFIFLSAFTRFSSLRFSSIIWTFEDCIGTLNPCLPTSFLKRLQQKLLNLKYQLFAPCLLFLEFAPKDLHNIFGSQFNAAPSVFFSQVL